MDFLSELANLGVCDVTSDPALCDTLYVAGWILFAALILSLLIFAIIKVKKKRVLFSHKEPEEGDMCPKCKKGTLKERAFTDQALSIGPDGKMGRYRQFYLLCTNNCSYKKKSRNPELICSL